MHQPITYSWLAIKASWVRFSTARLKLFSHISALSWSTFVSP
jgi:hypothetical protein